MNRYPDIRRNHPVRLSHLSRPVSGLTSESGLPSHVDDTVAFAADCMTNVMRLLTVAGAAHVGLVPCERARASCFPFNCPSKLTGEHQNPVSVGEAMSLRQ